MRIYYSLCICLFSFFLQAQDTYNPDKSYSLTQVQEDFDILVQSLESLHPAFYEFKPKAEFDAYINDKRAGLMEEMTEGEFHVIARRLIAEMGCGHTLAYPSTDWYAYQKENPSVMPLTVYLLNDDLYIEYYKKDSLRRHHGHEILSINDRSSSDIIEQMRSIQQKDGYSKSFVDASVQKTFATYHSFLFGGSDTYKVTYEDSQGKQGEIILKGGPRILAPLKKEASAFEGEGLRLSYDDVHKDLAILDIDNFASKDFKKNYKFIFGELERKNIDHLVIDLRNNGGGYFPNGNTLCRYLLDEKFEMKFSRPKGKSVKNNHAKMIGSNKMTKNLFNLMPDKDKNDPDRNYATKYKPFKKNHYDGKVYVLTNGGSFSMSGLVATRMKYDRNATIIGSETGGGENGSYAILYNHFTLPNTKVRGRIPYYFLDHNVTPEKKGRGVIPDVLVDRTISDIVSGRDLHLEAMRDLLK